MWLDHDNNYKVHKIARLNWGITLLVAVIVVVISLPAHGGSL